MTTLSRQKPLKIGLTRVNDCCVFTWTQAHLDAAKTIDIQTWHCSTCVEAAARMGFNVAAASPLALELRPTSRTL